MRTILTLLATLLAVYSAAGAQELPKATRITGVDWYRATFLTFKPGAGDEARQIIYQHFIKADQAAGRNPIAFDFETGEWHQIVYFPLQDGPGDFAWSTRPIDERWWAELARLEGSPQAARKIVSRFGELIEREETQVARRTR